MLRVSVTGRTKASGDSPHVISETRKSKPMGTVPADVMPIGSTEGLSPSSWARDENATTPTPVVGGLCGHAFRLESLPATGTSPEGRGGYWYCGIVGMWDYEIMELWNWVETFSISVCGECRTLVIQSV